MEKSRKNIHLINELPHIYELEDMMEFCKKHKSLYIYGRSENQEYLLKYFDMCGVLIKGYVVSYLCDEEIPFIYREMPVKRVEDVWEESGVGIILAIADRHYGKIIPMLRERCFHEYLPHTNAGQIVSTR